MRLIAAFIFLSIVFPASAAYSCLAVDKSAKLADFEDLRHLEASEIAFIGVVVFHVDRFEGKRAPIFSGATPVFKVLKNFANTEVGQLEKGLRGSTCGEPSFSDIGEFYLYRSNGKTGKPSQRLLFDSQNFAAVDYIKKNFSLDLHTVDKSVSISSRIKFEIRRNYKYLLFGVIGAVTALIYRRKKLKRPA